MDDHSNWGGTDDVNGWTLYRTVGGSAEAFSRRLDRMNYAANRILRLAAETTPSNTHGAEDDRVSDCQPIDIHE